MNDKFRWGSLGLYLLLLLAACTAGPWRKQQANPPYTFNAEELLIDQPNYAYQWAPVGQRLLLLAPEPPNLTPYEPVDRALAMFEPATGRVTELPRHGYAPLWSPDGRAIFFSSGDPLNGTYQQWLYQIETATLVPVAPLPAVPQQWLQDGRLVYTLDDGLWTMTLPVSATVDTAPDALVPSTPQRWFVYDTTQYDQVWPAPNGTAIVFSQLVNEHSRVLSMVLPTGKQVDFERSPDGLGICCAWSNDGASFAVISFEPEYGLYVVDNKGGNRRLVVAGSGLGAGRMLAMTFAPDSRTLAFEWQRAEQPYFEDTQLYAVNIDGTNLHQLTPNASGAHRWPRWSPGANLLLSERPSPHGTMLWLTRLRPIDPVAVGPVMLPEPRTPTTAAKSTNTEFPDDGFLLVVDQVCPHQLDLSLSLSALELATTTGRWQDFPFAPADDLPFLGAQRGLPLRRLQGMTTVDATGWVTVDTAADRPSTLASHWREPRRGWGRPATLRFDGLLATLVEPVIITASAEALISPTGLRCDPPQAVSIRGNAGWLLRQQATKEAGLPAINTLIWREDGAYWRLNSIDPTAGGDYSAEQLLTMAREEMAEYNSAQVRWQLLE
ncbi:MAG TPA: hypothetical protein P5121_09205 [Caldilineaceae bacterium]|nr:hypothetical protein [Caldilineaceae bacterium]